MISRVILVAWITLCVSAGVWVSIMRMDNKPPYRWTGSPGSYMVPNPAKQGDAVTANWKLLEVNRLCPATLQRFFRDHKTGQIVATLDTTEASRSVAIGDSRLPRSFRLPPGLPPVVDYSTLVCFECNLYQKLVAPLCIMTPSITFSVEN